MFSDIIRPKLRSRCLTTGNKLDSSPVGCVSPTCQLYVLVTTTRCQYHYGGGLKVNKFEQVPSDDHKVPRFDVWRDVGTLSCNLSHDTCDVLTPPQTHTRTDTNVYDFMCLRGIWRKATWKPL